MVAEAEIAWPDLNIAGLTAEQDECSDHFVQQGWSVHLMDSGVSWVAAITDSLAESSAENLEGRDL